MFPSATVLLVIPLVTSRNHALQEPEEDASSEEEKVEAVVWVVWVVWVVAAGVAGEVLGFLTSWWMMVNDSLNDLAKDMASNIVNDMVVS